MFALPSIWNLVVSTIVFFVAAWYVRRYLDEQGIPQGVTRSLLVFCVASLVAWGAGNAVDWAVGTSTDEQASADLSQLLKSTNQQSQ